MAEVQGRPTVTLQITLALSEEEARALEAFASYDEKKVLNVFFEHIGTSALEPHQAGFLSLLRSARLQLPYWLDRANRARDAFNREGR